jgi:hypothetical protein
MIAHDPMVYVPNLLGLLLAIFQLILFVIFGFDKDALANDFSSKNDEATPIKNIIAYNPVRTSV